MSSQQLDASTVVCTSPDFVDRSLNSALQCQWADRDLISVDWEAGNLVIGHAHGAHDFTYLGPANAAAIGI